MDGLGLVKTVDHLGQGVVTAVANNADRWFNPSLGEALGVLDRDILASTVTVVNQAATVNRPSIMNRLLQSIENKARMRCSDRRDRQGFGWWEQQSAASV